MNTGRLSMRYKEKGAICLVSAVTYPTAVMSDWLNWLVDFLNGRCNDRRAVCGVMEFQLHSTTDKAHLEHGTAPGRACDGHLNRVRTVLRMS